MSWPKRVQQRYRSSTLGKNDIPRWVGVILLLAVVYVTLRLPSEYKPLSVLGTIPRSGATEVPADTILVVLFGTNGFEDTFGDREPVVVVRYDGDMGTETISTTVTYKGDVLWAVPVEPLPPGLRVEAAAATQFDRDLIWHFTLTDDLGAQPATPVPPLE
jgi:hypothetical protein